MTELRFATLDPADVVYGRVDQVSPTIRRVIAQNPSKFTYHGTGTYLIGRGDVVVIDPGPLLDSHRDALAAALRGERVRAILVTHCHADHSPLAAWLSAGTGAPTVAFGPHPRPDPADLDADLDDDSDPSDSADRDRASRPGQQIRGTSHGNADEDGMAGGDGSETKEGVNYEFVPDVAVADGEVAFEGAGLRFTAVHTPGHTSNHTCYAYAGESALFTGDHVMGWSTTVVSPPDGDMAAYVESLERVAARADDVLWPTHGPPRHDGAEYVRALVEHRRERERQVLDAVRAGHATIPEIVSMLYADVRPELHKPAGRSVLAHLVKSVTDGDVVVVDGDRPRLSSTYAAV